MILYGQLTSNQLERKRQIERRKLRQAKVEKRSQLMLGELKPDSVVWHPYYRLGYVFATTADSVYVMFGNNNLVPLAHNERVAAWERM